MDEPFYSRMPVALLAERRPAGDVMRCLDLLFASRATDVCVTER